MTTETNDTTEQYTISGTGPYAYSFRIFDEDDLAVTALAVGGVDPVTLTVNSNFTVAGVNDEDGGTITLINNAQTTYAGYTLDIRSNTPVEQPTSIKNQGTFAPVVHEKAFDRLSRQIQDLARKVKQSFRYPDNVNLDGVMSLRSSWLGKYLYVNSSGVMEPASSIGSTALTQSLIGSTLYPITPAETDNSVTPQSYNYSEYGEANFARFLTAAQFVAAYVGVTLPDLTAEVQLAVNTYKEKRIPLIFGPLSFKIVGEVLVYSGTVIRGCKQDQYFASYGTPRATHIEHEPTAANQDVFRYVAEADFVVHTSISGLFIHGDGGTNSRYGINIDEVIYGNFYNMSIDGFKSAIRCYKTIKNRFDNILCTGTEFANVYSGGSATSDSWTNCTFFGSPVGNRHIGSNIGIMYLKCNWEQLNIGMENDRECQSIIVDDYYIEDVPYTTTAGNAMFKIGHGGTVLVTENALIIGVGIAQGRNAGTTGSFIDAGYCDGIMFGGGNVSRFTNAIKATANTRLRSIFCTGFKGIGVTNIFADATSEARITGIYPNANLENAAADMNAIFGSLDVRNTITSTGGDVISRFCLSLYDGITAPSPVATRTQIYVDVADGDLKVVFPDGVIKTLATDT